MQRTHHGRLLCIAIKPQFADCGTQLVSVNRLTVDGTSYPLPMSMNDLEQALDPARFFRLNRQYIANIKGIRKISFYFGSKLMVKLKGCEDDNIVISKEKAASFKKWLEK